MINKTSILSYALVILTLTVCAPAGKSESPVLKKIQEGALIIDVRTPGEVAAGIYPGAKNIPLAELESRLSEFGPKDGNIVVYCRSGSRSSQAKRILESNGYTNVTNGGGLRDMPSSN